MLEKDKEMGRRVIFPAEWYPQSAIQLTWPHEGTDWAPILDEVIPCFVAIAKEVIKREKLLIVCPDEAAVRKQLGEVDYGRIIFREMETNALAVFSGRSNDKNRIQYANTAPLPLHLSIFLKFEAVPALSARAMWKLLRQEVHRFLVRGSDGHLVTARLHHTEVPADFSEIWSPTNPVP